MVAQSIRFDRASRALERSRLSVLFFLLLLGVAVQLSVAASAAAATPVEAGLAESRAGFVSSLASASSSAGLPTGAVMKTGACTWGVMAPYDGGDWATADDIGYYADDEGFLTTVIRDASGRNLTIQTLNPSARRRVGSARSISLVGWPCWGGFYAAPDGYLYVLVGRSNYQEDDNRNVVAVRRYDREWNLAGTAYLKAGLSHGDLGVYEPFLGGAPHMVLAGDRLVVHMGRLIYAFEGVHHQMNLTFWVDIPSMTATLVDGIRPGCSHSFQQLVVMNGSDLILVDHGDAYPRAIQMGVMADYPAYRPATTYDLFEFNGEVGDNFTGAALTGLVSGPSGIVVLGNSIRQPDAPDGPLGSFDEHRNIFTIAGDPDTGAHRVRWLTAFAAHGSAQSLEPRVVEVATDKYAVLFSVHHKKSGYRMEYRLIDSAGTLLAEATFANAFFCAASEPVCVGGMLYWLGTEAEPATWPQTAYLYGLDVSDPTAPHYIDTTPPTTSVGGLPAAWSRTAVSLSFSASDESGGTGVATTQYRVDGGAWTSGLRVTIDAPADHTNDGKHTVGYRSTDVAGNREAAKAAIVRIDTLGPRIQAKAVSTKRNRSTKLRYRATDALSAKIINCKLVIRNAKGKVVKTFRVSGTRMSGRWYSASWQPTAPGTYRYYVYANDQAGNAQSKVGKAKVVVK